MSHEQVIERLAELIVAFGANVQPGQVVAISSEPGKEALTRAIAAAAYRRGALFVDVSVFDQHVKRARALYADPETLGYVPPWYGKRVLELGELRSANVGLSGPVAPRLMDDVDPALLGIDMLPRVKESVIVVNDASTNWTISPCPTPAWAELVHPSLQPAQALDKLWEQIAHVCRLDEPDPIQAWRDRFATLSGVATKLTGMQLDSLRFEGPGTDLTVGLLPSSTWLAANFTTAGGIEHAPNVPSEEVFTTPDPLRVEGHVRSTKPLFTSGALIEGLSVRFEGGRAVQIEAERGADTLRSLAARDDGAARLGEVALVDREGRIGPLNTTFYDTLLDENAASHIAIGAAYLATVGDERDHPRANVSEVHVDFMIGGEDVAVTGIAADGSEIPLLRGGSWQI
jgi:aminopeptidase